MIKNLINVIIGNYYLKKSRIAIQEKRWEEAIVNADKSLKYSPNLGVLNNKGIALWKLEKYKEAIECFDIVIASYDFSEDESIYAVPGVSEEGMKHDAISAMNNKGSLLNQIGKKNEARNLHKMLLQLDHNRKSAIHNLRIDLMPDYEEVSDEDIFKSVKQNLGSKIARKVIIDEIEAYDSTLKKNPNDVTTLTNKGVALAEINEFNEAMSCYDLALKIDSANIGALCNKGGTFGRMGNHEEAIQCFDKILKIEPNHKQALKNKKLAINLKNKIIRR